MINVLMCGSGAVENSLKGKEVGVFFCSSQSDQPATENSQSSFYLYKGVITPSGWSVTPAVITGGSFKTWIWNIRQERDGISWWILSNQNL